jgi:hypothetical protein
VVGVQVTLGQLSLLLADQGAFVSVAFLPVEFDLVDIDELVEH